MQTARWSLLQCEGMAKHSAASLVGCCRGLEPQYFSGLGTNLSKEEEALAICSQGHQPVCTQVLCGSLERPTMTLCVPNCTQRRAFPTNATECALGNVLHGM